MSRPNYESEAAYLHVDTGTAILSGKQLTKKLYQAFSKPFDNYL